MKPSHRPELPDQACHNDFEIRENKKTEFFVLVSVSEPTPLLFCPVYHLYVCCPMTKKKKYSKFPEVEEV